MRRHSAFTLLELILAMGLVAMLSLTLYSCFNTAYKAKRTAESTVKPVRAVSAAMELITKDIQNTVKPVLTATMDPTAIPPQRLARWFAGGYEGGMGSEAAWLDFHTIGSDAIPNLGAFSEGIRRVVWTTRSEGTTTLLVRRVTRNILAPEEQEPEEQIICRDVKAFALRYYDDQTGEWYEEWDSTGGNPVIQLNQIPTYVQVDLTVGLDTVQQRNQQQRQYHVTRVIPIATAP
jgi:type II secretion system protein J